MSHKSADGLRPPPPRLPLWLFQLLQLKTLGSKISWAFSATAQLLNPTLSEPELASERGVGFGNLCKPTRPVFPLPCSHWTHPSPCRGFPPLISFPLPSLTLGQSKPSPLFFSLKINTRIINDEYNLLTSYSISICTNNLSGCLSTGLVKFDLDE